ncbi:MAG: methylthioribulose 1-phosphate dehydratase [Deltaproteobacteria bacterium]|jgi:methylthioribulose-1-phosphate dehydratase
MHELREGDAILRDGTRPREVICELARRFHALGWVSGTGGGISIKDGERILMAPSGVQKELVAPEDLFVLDVEGAVLERPRDPGLSLSACAPLFLHAFRKRGAGAVLHSHSMHAMCATLLTDEPVFRASHLEMIKGVPGHGYHDELVVPILENTAHECDLADALGAAIDAFPKTSAVLVRRHGVYVWGESWQKAKTTAECLDYVFEAAIALRRLGVREAEGTRCVQAG